MRQFSMRAFVLVFACLTGLAICRADELAAVTGLVTDPNGRSVPGVTVIITNLATNVASRTVTNDQGVYRVPSLQPGIYRMTLDKDGFKSIVKSGIELHVQDVASINFELQIGSVNETVTVEAGGLVMNTTDASVSTVVDRQFAENLPMSGRSFQTLIELTPGVTLTTSSFSDSGQFSVNGQRASSNYWMVDGVSANIGISSYVSPGTGIGGSLGSFSALGGTNSLVSVDALQEFRIQTSTYAPEFGRTPGGQISIVTRSGTNQFHGTAFDYLRNDVLDANNWFANFNRLPKPKERQNDFGGTFSGPILKDRTFFFFSYEGLRIRSPQVAQTFVPDATARQNAVPAMQPFLNAFPLPNGTDNASTGVAQSNASYSNPGALNAYSLRIDHRLRDKLTLFGRYNYSPSEIVQRAPSPGDPLSTLYAAKITTHTGTVGASFLPSASIANDLRFNYSRTYASSYWSLDNFGGAVPLMSSPFPTPYTNKNGNFFLDIFSLGGQYGVGKSSENVQRQFNLIDTLTMQRGSHSLKFGADYRHLSPSFGPYLYLQSVFFGDVPSAETGDLSSGFGYVSSSIGGTFLFQNLGVYAQDTWRIIPRLTLTYGLRWDVDFTPSTSKGPDIPAVTGFNLNDFSKLALAPRGTTPFNTKFGNVGPRIGLAYQFSQNQNWGTVIRGGFGIFYDLADGELGNLLGYLSYPFGATNSNVGNSFPLSPANAAPPPITAGSLVSGTLTGFDPGLELPYTLQWNGALEQALGKQQTLTASYIGSTGRRLIQSAFINSPNANYGSAYLITNAATSDYNAFQLQLQRRLSRGLQAIASYTWAHSIDTASAGSLYGNAANDLVPGLNPKVNRGPSDFDIRNAFSGGMTYELPAPKLNAFTNVVLRGWSLQTIVQARSAPPDNIYYAQFRQFNGARAAIRPDLIPGQPLYLYGPQYPGGKAFNPAAFTKPPTDPNTRLPLRQGSLGRNTLRGFGATQWDFAVHRDFPIHESIKLQFRAEMLNVLNHPNFALPYPYIGFPGFGTSTQTLADGLNNGNLGGGGFSSLYQIGGPRSIQLALKVMF